MAVLIESELPRYVCHKEAGALKITAVRPQNDAGRMAYLDVMPASFGPILTSEEWIAQKAVEPGGYLVFYNDGYRSYSPVKAFEEGYTPKESK